MGSAVMEAAAVGAIIFGIGCFAGALLLFTVQEKRGYGRGRKDCLQIVSAEKVAYVMHICECRKQTACYSANKL